MYGEVIIATYNREKELHKCLEHIEKSSIYPDKIIIVDASPQSDFTYNGKLNVDYIHTDKAGSSVQRNIGINKLNKDTEVVTFLDDDFYVDSDYFKNLYKRFKKDTELVGAEGALRRDGKNICEIPEHDKRVSSLYGCNMSFRVSAIGTTRFDENLKLYAFKEDWDFGLYMAEKGKLLRLYKCTGIHDQSQNKPVNDRKMGYMVVANDCYLRRKHRIFKIKDIAYYLAYMAKHLLLSFKKRSRERFIGAVKGFWTVVILREKV